MCAKYKKKEGKQKEFAFTKKFLGYIIIYRVIGGFADSREGVRQR